ncbi:Kef-type K+ transport system, membrane component KefB [Marinilactibacillus piezotolerans]|uniref:Kef-type K+ transport system, membrane component KefB n=2 Tax=Marinilactibacillus piezotolerans TaxID=258723 RepID=A0A1I3ZC83_9LACT|nr:Kef-type K+ transport system, membrane component KefB [Marinilactibacillus piezotolerans]
MFYVALTLLVGSLFGRLAAMIKLPTVTGYIFGGLLLGPSFFHIMPENVVESMDIISEIALAFISFTIGLSFKASYLRRVGLTPLIIAALESTLAAVLVASSLFLIGTDPAFALIMGAIAAATAPTSILLVMKEYRAKGPVSEMLKSVAALDDATALILFGFSSTAVKILVNTGENINILSSIFQPIFSVFLSLAIGAIIGFIMKYPLKYTKTSGQKLTLLIAFVFLTSSVSVGLGVSELLAAMMTGTVLTNISSDAPQMGEFSDRFTPPIFLMFFVLAGAQLNIHIIPTVGLIGIMYTVFRIVGKVTGAYFGSLLMRTPKVVRNYLGFMLLPQAGVGIGLITISAGILPEYADQIRTVVLSATLLYEFSGPVITKIVLRKTGEIQSIPSNAKEAADF